MKRLYMAIALATLPLAAQNTGEISGTVRDAAQSPVSGVRITVRNEATHSEVLAYTNGNGEYLVSSIDPGDYTVTASRVGFDGIAKSGLVLRPNARLRLDLEIQAAPAGRWSLPANGTVGFVIMSALIVALVGLLFTDPVRQTLKKIWSVLPWANDKIYEFMAPRFPDRIGMPGYRERVATSPSLTQIENRVGPEELQGRVSLDRAFAPIAVTTGDAEERVDLLRFAEATTRFVLLGGPGTGKSTLMKYLTLSVANGRCGSSLDLQIPVFVVLREMSAAGHTVEQAINSAMGALRFKNSGKFVGSALKVGRTVIVLDGLDEVGTNRQAVAARIREFCLEDDNREATDQRRNRVVLTCREASYRNRDLADVIPSPHVWNPFPRKICGPSCKAGPLIRAETLLRFIR